MTDNEEEYKRVLYIDGLCKENHCHIGCAAVKSLTPSEIKTAIETEFITEDNVGYTLYGFLKYTGYPIAEWQKTMLSKEFVTQHEAQPEPTQQPTRLELDYDLGDTEDIPVVWKIPWKELKDNV